MASPSSMLFTFGLLLAFTAGTQGGRPLQPPLPFAEAAGVSVQEAKPRSLRVDYAFGGGPSCRDFWQASGPRQDQPPVTAWRQAVKATFTAGIQDKGVSAAVASLSVVCNDPAPESQSDLRRLIITVKLTPDLTLDELNLVDLGFRKEEYLGVLEDVFSSVAGDSSPFAPIQFDYSDGDTQYLCAVGLGGCPPLRWDPTSVVTIED